MRGVALNSEVILTADENSDIFMWDAELAVKGDVSDGDPNLLLHTLTGEFDVGNVNEASRYDVRPRGGGGSWKSGCSKGGCVNF